MSVVRDSWFLAIIHVLCFFAVGVAQERIPHAQDKPPGPPLSVEQAIKKMTVPEGFSVECVAHEPDIVNPVAMTIDERGRFWITESLEYPRREPGAGRDRVKIAEDTDGDGKADKFTIFLDGLNIPSGVAVGHGGVWIANSPDILFVPDADRDGEPDGPPRVVVTGFGRTDTHELPNSLTWGPDGWLYGLNGVFNHSKVTYPKDSPWLKHVAESFHDSDSAPSSSDSKSNSKATPDADGNASHGMTRLRTEFNFTCAMFRIHPRTWEFQIFAEGTSNPWGIAFNDEGEAFISACVIDHLWHIVETGYYHRQGGPYPPFTWKIDSIVKHKHQKAAYCGIHYFDSDAYPEQYRGKLYMGNIHGGCINVDKLQRDGSTYFATGEPDFLTANDAWFMPVVQKTGPDGCLYILDWYDRYHCYQDANRDPAGIDRLKGRLYRVRYNGKEAANRSQVAPQPGSESRSDSATKKRVYPQIDLAKETDEQLIDRLGANNDFIRWTATRLLQERDKADLQRSLINVALTSKRTQQRYHAMFSAIGIGSLSDGAIHELFGFSVPWAIRATTLKHKVANEVLEAIAHESRNTDDADMHRQLAVAALKIEGLVAIPMLLRSLEHAGKDQLIPRLVWQNLHPLLEEPQHLEQLLTLLRDRSTREIQAVADLMPRVVDRILGRQKFEAAPVAKLFALLRDDYPQVGRDVLGVLAAKVQSGELKGDKLEQLKTAMFEPLTPLLAAESSHPLSSDAALLAVSWGDQRGVTQIRRVFATRAIALDLRLKSLNALIAAKDSEVLESVTAVLADKSEISDFKSQILLAIGRLDERKVADVVLAEFPTMDAGLQPSAIELLTQRASWAKQLLRHVGNKQIAATAINVNQARRIQALKDAELNELLSRHWGQVRDTRSPDRERVVAEMKALIRQKPGDAFAGEKVFKRVCAACHKIYGEGPEIGPDITSNGRNDFNQLLSNVFDPSLVIGAGYRVCTVITKQGRVQSGLLVEDSPQRVVLKPAAIVTAKPSEPTKPDAPVTVAVGKLEIVPRDEIEEFKINELSLMPELLEKQLTQQEIVDLFAYLTLDKHPSDRSAKRLPGVTAPSPRESANAAEFPSIIAEILPGFTATEAGEGGIAILKEHFGREGVLRTHPISRDKPSMLSQKFTPPAGKQTRLILEVSHDPRGDWRLVVRGNGERLADEMVSKQTCQQGWRTIIVDLTKFAGQEVKVDLVNQANDWLYEFGYWGAARFVTQ